MGSHYAVVGAFRSVMHTGFYGLLVGGCRGVLMHIGFVAMEYRRSLLHVGYLTMCYHRRHRVQIGCL